MVMPMLIARHRNVSLLVCVFHLSLRVCVLHVIKLSPYISPPVPPERTIESGERCRGGFPGGVVGGGSA